MSQLSFRRFLTHIRIRYLVMLVILLGALIFLVTSYIIQKSKASMLEVMETQGKALLETLVLASENTLTSNALIEQALIDDLSDIALLIENWEKSGTLNENLLAELAGKTGLLRLDILSTNGKILKSSSKIKDKKIYLDSLGNFLPEMRSILKGEDNQALLEISGLSSSYTGGVLFVQRSSSEKKVMALIVLPSYLDEIKKEVGIGFLIEKISRESGIEYIVLQAQEGIVFASRTIEKLLKIEKDPFLQEALNQNQAKSRILDFEGRKVLEVVKPFVSNEFPAGIFRVGLSLENYKLITSNFQKQTILISLIIFALGFLVIGLVIAYQNYFTLERSYKEIESLTGNILESMDNAVVAIDAKRNIVMLNKIAENLFSLSRESVIGKKYGTIFPHDECLLTDSLNEEKAVRDFETSFKTRVGESKTLLIGSSGIFDEEGKIMGAVAVIHDITEFKKLEEETKRSERLSALGNLAAGVAHEIRNPLNTISIASQRLKSEFTVGSNKTEYENFLKSIIDETKRLNNIVNQFLSLTKAQKLSLVSVNIREFLEELLSLLKLEAEEKKISWNTNLKAEANLKIDREEMTKALLNIILNAIQATEPGGRISVVTSKNNGDFLIKISDTGKGIPKDDLSKIFQPYFTTKERGTGLGLSIAHRIISDHKGKIEVESEVGKGTTFTIYLPLN